MIGQSNSPMQMYNTEEVWLPQKNLRDSCPIPQEVVPHYEESTSWFTVPRSQNGKKKLIKKPQSAECEEAANSGMKMKDYIELTKTVKNSLILSENEDTETTPDAPLHPPERHLLHSTYKMPPLTPTVANLIHTSSVVKKSYSSLETRPATPEPARVAETSHLVTDGPDHYKNRSYPVLEHRSGCRRREGRSNGNNNTEDKLTQRYSWTSVPEETGASFGKLLAQPSYSVGTTPQHFDRSPKTSKVKGKAPLPPTRNFALSINDSQPTVGHGNHSPLSEQSTSFGKAPFKKGPSAPPPPPKRSPNTKLSRPSESNKANVSPPESQNSSSSSSRKSSIQSLSLVPESRQLGEVCNLPPSPNSPEGELPVLPPPLPLYNPTARFNDQSALNPNLLDLPAPPPPPPDMMISCKLSHNDVNARQIATNGIACDFPPPPSLM